MAFKFILLASFLAYANAGIIGAPAAVAYSAAPAVSSTYFHQPSYAIAQPAVAVAQPAPVLQSYAAASPVSIHAPAFGASHQSVERSLGGAQSVSHYSKAIDSAFSSVRKYDTRITNDALVAQAPVYSTYSSPVYAKPVAPIAAYGAPVVTKTYQAPVAYQSPIAYQPPVAYAQAPGPVVTKAAVAYSPATVVAHTTFTGLGTAYQW